MDDQFFYAPLVQDTYKEAPASANPRSQGMKKAALSFLLVVLIKAVSAIAAYLKDRLMGNLHRPGFGPGDDPDLDFSRC
jgi:hypothetical protein